MLYAFNNMNKFQKHYIVVKPDVKLNNKQN